MPDVNYISSNALNLIEFSKMSNNPIIKDISKSFIDAGHIGRDIPFLTDANPVTIGSRWIGGFPIPNWGDINSPNFMVNAVPEPYSEQKWLILNGIQLSKYYSRAKNTIGNLFKQQTKAYLWGLAFDTNDKFFNNDPANGGNAKAFTGIFPRIQASAVGVPGKYGVNPECYRPQAGTDDGMGDGGTGTSVDMSGTGISAANTNTLIAAMQFTLNALNADEGDDTIIYVNQTLLARLEEGVRLLGAGAGWTTGKDGYDRSVVKYKNAMIRNCGRKAPSANGVQNQFNISSTQNANGTNGLSNYTSMAFVRKGTDTFCFTQFEDMVADDPIRLPDGVTDQANFNWMIGLWQPDTRAIAQLPGIQIS